MSNEMTVVEINGIKMEIDLRTARRIDTFRVGDGIKVLRKRYGTEYEVMPGAIVGFAEFQKLPTIEVVCITHGGSVEFISFNSQSTDVELAPMNRYEMAFDRAAIEATLIRAVESAQSSVRDAEAKLKAFRTEIVKAFDLQEAVKA